MTEKELKEISDFCDPVNFFEEVVIGRKFTDQEKEIFLKS